MAPTSHGHPDNLHWMWDTGLLQHVSRNLTTFAASLERQIAPGDEAEWRKGSIADWAGRASLFKPSPAEEGHARAGFRTKPRCPSWCPR